MSVTDNGVARPVDKKQDEVGIRLQRAALELFRARGYDFTTAAEIAALAGVTERTFFRYFQDKKEVLFVGEARLREALAASMANAPDDLGPIDTLYRAFRSVHPALENNRPFSAPRHEIITNTPALQERELAKMAALADALTEALKARGVAELQAVLAARTGMAAFVYATVSWLEDPAFSLDERLELAFRELKMMVTNARHLSSGRRAKPTRSRPKARG